MAKTLRQGRPDATNRRRRAVRTFEPYHITVPEASAARMAAAAPNSGRDGGA